MSDASENRGSAGAGLTLMGFALGAVVGAGVALLLAPDSGKKTRQRLATTAQRWTKNARQSFDSARETVSDLGADARSAVDAGRRAFQESHQNSDESRLATRNALKG